MPGFPSILLSLNDETKNLEGFPGGSVAKKSDCQYRRLGFNPWVRKNP